MKVVVAALLVLFECFGAVAGEACPPPCFCYPNFDIVGTITVDCRSLDLYEIPFPVPNGTSHLDLSGNLIQYIREADFPRGLTSLRFIQLQNNDVLNIEPGAFRRVPNLQTISLYNNRLRQLRAGVFDGLDNLQVFQAYNLGLESFEVGVFDSLQNIIEIDLSFNNVDRLPALSFVGLSRLQRLSLGDNSLVDIEALAIANLSSLSYLNLGYNNLMCITPRAFSRLPNLRTLVLAGNPIECGCCTVWLYDFLNRKNLNGPDCATPTDLRGTPLLDVQMDELCALPTATIQGSEEVYVVSGMNLDLVCSGTGAPPPQLSWSIDGRSFSEADDRITMSGGTLVITDVNEADSGLYYCSAQSSAGTVASSVRVQVLDVMSLLSSEVFGTRGQNMQLDCAPGLRQGAEVMWVFEMMSLVDSDKYSITDNGSLIVRSIDLMDMGIYMCVLGDIAINVTLTIQSIPEIVDFTGGPCNDPDRLIVPSNRDDLLFCSAFAIPPPNITLIYRNMIVNMTMPPPSMVGGVERAEFLLGVALPPDIKLGGNFTCIATNEVGTAVRTVEVIVQTFVVAGRAIRFPAQVGLVGDTAVLECNTSVIVTTSTNLMFTWSITGGGSLPEKAVFTQNNQTLILSNLTLEDNQMYRCLVIAPDAGEFFALTYPLSVFEMVMARPECATPTVRGLVGESVTLRCPATGNPVPRRVWSRNGVDVTSPESPLRDRQVTMNDGAELIISDLMEEDSGLFNCFVSNIIADFSPAVFNDSLDVILEVQRLPFFTFWPDALTRTTVGEIVRLWCGGRGIPPPTVTWWRRLDNDTVVEVISDRHIVIYDEGLVFAPVQKDDEAVYYCNISSPLQTRISNDAMLRVFVPPTLGPLPLEYVFIEGDVNRTLDCFGRTDQREFIADPEPTVHWLRDGRVLPFPREHAQLPNGSLVIFMVTREDAGSYVCRLANAAGMVYHNTTLTVRTFPDTIVEPSMLVAAVGSQVTLFCTDGGQQPSEFSWSFNEEVIAPSTDVFIRQSGELILTNVQVEDSGNYTCRIWGVPGPREDSAFLVVEDRLFASGAPSSPPTIITSTPSMLIVAPGDTLQFVCLAEGFPPPVVTWLKNGVPQPNYSRVTIIPGGALTIENARVTDAALYHCVATNALGTSNSSFNVTISSPPQFTVLPQAQSLLVNQVLRLQCEAEGSPTPEITWRFNDVMIVTDGRRFIDPASNNLSVFNTSIAGDTGSYTCVASNSAGTSQYSVPVNFTDLMIAPTIISVNGTRSNLVVGEMLSVACIAEGFPIPDVTWFHNGTQLENCTEQLRRIPAVCAEYRKPSATLLIISAKLNDTGQYICTADNSVGSTAYSVFISVQTPTSPPFFLVYPSPVMAFNGSLIFLDCLAGGEPEPTISWLKDFTAINLTFSDNIVLEANGTLVIMEADFEDTGFYTCVADNGLGINQVSVSVEVIPEIPINKTAGVGSSPPVILSAPIGVLMLLPLSSATLDCSAVGEPTPTIIWFKDTVPLATLPSSTSIKLLGNGSVLLSSVTDREEGVYRCLAVNSEGSAEVRVQVEVTGGNAVGTETSPLISTGPQDQSVLSGSKVRLDCISEGVPTPFVLWTSGHDSSPVYQEPGVTVSANGSLIFESVGSSHNGTYTCWAVSSGGASQRHAKLTVTDKKEPPYFKVKPTSSIVVVQGDHFMLHCEAYSVGSLPTELSWRRRTNDTRGEVIEGDERVMVLAGEGVLLVTEARLGDDSGMYSCAATNIYGTSIASSHVTVLSRPVNSTVRAEEGGFVILRCGLSGKDVEWTKNGESITSYDGEVWLFDVDSSDEGEYSCTLNSQTNNHLLLVQAAPSIISSSTVVFANEGGSATLHCVAQGRPHPQTHWYHGNVLLSTPSVHYGPLHNGTLLVYEATSEMGGAYTCEAENSAGTAKAFMRLIILKN